MSFGPLCKTGERLRIQCQLILLHGRPGFQKFQVKHGVETTEGNCLSFRKGLNFSPGSFVPSSSGPWTWSQDPDKCHGDVGGGRFLSCGLWYLSVELGDQLHTSEGAV